MGPACETAIWDFSLIIRMCLIKPNMRRDLNAGFLALRYATDNRVLCSAYRGAPKNGRSDFPIVLDMCGAFACR
jgi:hypothetical protein